MMGFIMDRGPGTDEILEHLYRAFFLNIEDTATDFLADFDDGKSLVAAATNVGIRPSDGKHHRKWKKWLRWLLSQPNNAQHETVRKLIKNCLRANPPTPIIFDWQEDPNATANTLPVIVPGDISINNRAVKTIAIVTCAASKLP